MAWSRAEDEVRTFIERAQIRFLRSQMGKGVMPDDHAPSARGGPHLGIGERRYLSFRPAAALHQGYEGHPARHRARGDRHKQGDRGGSRRPTGRAVGPPEDRLWQGNHRLRGTEQSRAATAGRQRFHPKDTPRRQQRRAETAQRIPPEKQTLAEFALFVLS